MAEVSPKLGKAVAGLVAELQKEDPDAKSVFGWAKAVCKLKSDDTDAIHCKAMALLDRNQPDQALAVLDTLPKPDQDRLFLMRGYALYKKKSYPEVLKLLGRFGEQLGSKHLEAQTLYKMGRFEDARKCYDALLQATEDSVDVLDKLTNLSACFVATGDKAGLAGLKSNFEGLEEQNSEVPYNLALVLMGEGRHAEAEAMLTKLRHDLDEDDLLQFDLAIAYCMHLQGKTEQAKKILKSLEGAKGANKTTLTNNLLAATIHDHRSKIYDALWLLRGLDTRQHSDLLPAQRKTLQSNRAVAMLLAKDTNSCLAFSQTLARKDPGIELPVLIKAGLAMKRKNHKRAKTLLEDHLKANPNADSPQSHLALARLHLVQQKPELAIKELLCVKSLQHFPAMVATLVALYRRQGQDAPAVDALQTAIGHWKKAQNPSLASLLQSRLAELLLELGRGPEAVSFYQTLLRERPHDPNLKAQLAIALAATDPEAGEEALAGLPTPASMQDLDAQDLLNEPVDLPSEATQAEVNVDLGKIQEKVFERRREQRKRKPRRLPKGVTEADPNFKPDPNRWLPSRKKRKRYQKGGAQGGADKGREQKLDIQQKKTKRKKR